MKASAFIFPGQGSQKPGMGKDIYEAYPDAREIFDTAGNAAGIDVKALCFEGTEDELKKTENTQPCIVTVSIAAWRVLAEKGFSVSAAAGHSLGEFAALVAGGYLSFADAVKAVRERGLIMAGADKEGKGAMAAVLGLSSADVAAVCAETPGAVVANYNDPGQTVISGEKTAVEAAGAKLKEKGAKRVVPLPVSGAFHSPLMTEASKEFAGVLAKMNFTEGKVPVFSNVTAKPHVFAEIRTRMAEQMYSSVRWVDSMAALSAMKPALCIEAGPNKVLAGLMKKCAPDVAVQNAGTAAEIAAILG